MSNAGSLILYVITDLDLGGVPLHLSRLAPAMKERGFQVVVVSLARRGPVGPILAGQGIDVRSCEGCCGLDFRVISRLGEIIDEFHPDLMHSFLFHANQAVRIVALLSGIPTNRLVCEIQTVEIERPWHLWVDRFTHGFCRLTIGNSPSVIDHLHQRARIPQDRLRLVRGGVDIERIQSAVPASRLSLGLKESDRVLIWVGRLDPVKGLDLLIEALSEVTRRLDARLLLVGEGPERPHLEKLSKKLGLPNSVRFLGPRTDVQSLLQVADLFVFPSRTEGLPNALLEAMAAGLPIVTTDVPGCRDLISHGQSGLLVPYGDRTLLADAIIQLLANPRLAREMADKAEEVVTMHWNIEATYRSYESIYHEMLAENARH